MNTICQINNLHPTDAAEMLQSGGGWVRSVGNGVGFGGGGALSALTGGLLGREGGLMIEPRSSDPMMMIPTQEGPGGDGDDIAWAAMSKKMQARQASGESTRSRLRHVMPPSPKPSPKRPLQSPVQPLGGDGEDLQVKEGRERQRAERRKRDAERYRERVGETGKGEGERQTTTG